MGRIIQGPAPRQGKTELRFEEIGTPFSHRSDFDEYLPFMALAAIDLDGDGVDELFAGGGKGQQDALLAFDGVGLIEAGRIQKEPDDATYGAASIDATGDGRPDLFVARDSGLYFYARTDSGFQAAKLEVPIGPSDAPLSIALADLDHDGWVDLYLSDYVRQAFVEGETIFNRPYGGTNLLLANNGDNTFRDITAEAGLFHRHNTFVSVFVDLNNNGESDLVLAHDTGQVSIYRNNGDLTFTEVSVPHPFSYPMGIGVADLNGDGLMDLYFSNVGSTLPRFMLRGDLTRDQKLHTDYILLQNNGDFSFTDVAAERNAARYGFGWGVVAADFNNDARADLLITQNYVRFPGVKALDLYTGHLLQQRPDGRFQPVEVDARIENKKFGITAVVTDFDQDGWPDAAIANLSGPLRVFMNQGGENNWLKVRLPDRPSSIGALITLTREDGSTMIGQYFTSEGLGSDQSSEVSFGLGQTADIRSVSIRYQDGSEERFDSPGPNTVIVAGGDH
jgi:enediyne biosynthesis protein E4